MTVHIICHFTKGLISSCPLRILLPECSALRHKKAILAVSMECPSVKEGLLNYKMQILAPGDPTEKKIGVRILQPIIWTALPSQILCRDGYRYDAIPGLGVYS